MSERTTAEARALACTVGSMQQTLDNEKRRATMRQNKIGTRRRVSPISQLTIAGIAAALVVALSACSQPTIDGAEVGSTVPSAPPLPAANPAAAIQAPRLESVSNFRDLAGKDGGYRTSDGRRVREGVLYRSNALVTSDADATTLDALGVKVVYDLRTDTEIARSPDRLPSGARYKQVDIIGDTASGADATSVDLSTPESAAALLIKANRQFVTDPSMRAQFSVLLTDIAAGDVPQIFHCTGGKDRTGWASAVLLKIAGVDDATVMSDYLLSNEYSKDSIAATAARVTTEKGEQAGAAMKVLMGVSPEFLEAGFDEIITSFGTFDNYLVTGLGLSTDTIAALEFALTA